MTFPRFFIDRPIFAIVLSILMVLAGIVAFFQLPLSEYPAVTPPTVQVTASYTGANPQVIAETVAAPLEQAITGVEGMLYMSSQSVTDGRMILTVTFARGPMPIWHKSRCRTEFHARCHACLKRFSGRGSSHRKPHQTF